MEFVNIGAKNASYGNITLDGSYANMNVQVGYERLPSAVENHLASTSVSIYPNPAQDKLLLT